jgi:hypothetical protein
MVGLNQDSQRVLAAAEGWGGDHWVFYQNGDERLFAGVFAWDTQNDAAEFFAALRDSEYEQAGTTATSSGEAFAVVVSGRSWYAYLSGERVTVVVSDDAAAAQRAAATLGYPSP